MFNKIKNWFNSNRGEISIIILFISAILLCANLFSKICDPIITIIGCCFTIIGISITCYDFRKK